MRMKGENHPGTGVKRTETVHLQTLGGAAARRLLTWCLLLHESGSYWVRVANALCAGALVKARVKSPVFARIQ